MADGDITSFEIISRKEAKERGLKFYFTGLPCAHGHISQRTVANWTCTTCDGLRDRLPWKRSNREKHRKWWRKSAGLPEPTRESPNTCECCGVQQSEKPRAFCLDHCHDTGKFRGWLCSACNLGIGSLGDNIEGIRNALRYLEKHGNN